MLVLDYLRFSSGFITIPPFHRGHLGLVSGTEVHISLALDRGTTQQASKHSELLVTPFEEPMDSLFRLECTMFDQPGALHRLLEAIWQMNINIVKQDSSIINQQEHYYVDMVLDWRTSEHSKFRPTPAAESERYSAVSHRVPLHDQRYVRLYESIMARCGSLVRFDNALGPWLPSIAMVPFTPLAQSSPRPTKIVQQRSQKRVPDVGLHVPAEQLSQIQFFTGYNRSDPVPYVISSDTNHRLLRIFIPNKQTVPHLVHVGFRHFNAPGASWAITRAIEKADFNILTSLVRQKGASEATLECLLEYRGKTLPPARSGDKAYSKLVLEWCRDLIGNLDERTKADLGRFSVILLAPEYPRRPGNRKYRLGPAHQAVRDDGTQASLGDDSIASEPAKLVEETLAAAVIAARERPDGAEKSRVEVIRGIQERLAHRRPRIFLSYPAVGKLHAEIIKRELTKKDQLDFDVRDYMSADFEEIVDSVRRRISECDYFIGLWHHEEVPGTQFAMISPWLPFEYGLAIACGKGCLIVYSRRLPEEVWRRINPGTSKEAYNDVEFQDLTVDKVKQFCKEHWWAEWEGM